MNLKHPYEKHLAEKLVQLPPPDDPDQNWQRMKTLLDKNMPRGGGGSGGSYRWWITGTVIVAVVVGTWFGGKTFLSKEQRNESVAGTIKTVNNKTAPSVASTEKNGEQPGVSADADPTAGSTTKRNNNLPGAAYASSTSPESNDNTAAGDEPVPVTTDKAYPKNYSDPKKDPAVNNSSAKNNTITIEEAEKARSSGNNENNPRLLAKNNNPATNETPSSYHNKTSPDRNKIYASDSKNNKTGAGKTRTTNTNNNRRQPVNNNNAGIEPDGKAVVTNATRRPVTSKKGKNPVKKAAADKDEMIAGNKENEKTPYTYKPKLSLPSQPSTGSELKESPVTYNINYTGASVVSPSGVIQREFTYYTQANLFPEKVTRNKTAKSKSSRASWSQEDKTFAVGLSLPLGFPVGDQQALGYNRNAGVNAISDYIPSPHFQYHFNNRTYIQAGMQFSAPQYIRPVLLYQDKVYSPGPTPSELITNITARKLYYFNLPVTIYHSPLRNFYMGAGLQYSSLLSGIAQYEKIKRSMVGPQEDVLENRFMRFRNDYLSSRLNGNEVRLLIDMSYYWSKFTVGLQYNQAFNNYVSFQVTPGSPYTFDKNKSLQFYLRYNIWEDKKRKQPKSMLSLK